MTSAIPLSGDEVHPFTPPTLANIVPTPTFRFRAATERDRQRYFHLLSSEGLLHYPKELVRAQMLTTLEQNWDAETYQKRSAQLLDYWTRCDQNDETKDESKHIPIADSEHEAVAELVRRCMEVSPMMRRMDADSKRFQDEAPVVALSMFLVGWSGMPTPFRLEAGVVPLDTMRQLQRDLFKIEEQARKDKVEGVTPRMGFLQLATHAFQLLSTDEEMEKNSSAPSPSSDTQTCSKTSSPRDGASTAAKRPTSSRRGKTPVKRSRKSIATS